MSLDSVANSGFFRLPAEGEDLWVLGGLYSYRATTSETGAYLACEVQAPGGFAIPVHYHDDEEEAFYVARGEATIFLDDRQQRLPAGGFALAVRGQRHAFRLETPDTALLLLLSPGTKHEQLFRQIGQRAGEHRIPDDPGPLSPSELEPIVERLGTHIVGPPPED